MHERMTVPVEWKAATGGGPGELEGYVSVFGNVDLGGDVVLPGAFRKTLADWSTSKQPLPLIADHELSTEGVIGSVKQAREDGVGLWIRAGFSSDPKAQSIRTKMIEGHLKGMSFTYDAVKQYMGQMGGKSVRFLQELKWFEATVTPFPMNTLALASAKAAMSSASINDLPDSAFAYIEPGGTKDAEGKTTPRELRHFPIHDAAHVRNALARIAQGAKFGDQALPKVKAAAKQFGVTVSGSSSIDWSQFADAMSKALGIGFAPAAKAAADLLVAAYHPLDDDTAAGPDGDPDPTADAAAPGEGTADGETGESGAAFAAALIAKPSGPRDGAPGGEPPDVALAGPLAQLEIDRAAREQDRLEAEIQSVLGGSR
jgi:HK97 family phage prohead protease